MQNIHPFLLCDTYKTVHHEMYPKTLTKLYSYWTPRRSMLKSQNKMVFFGLQAFIKEYLIEAFNEFFKNAKIDYYNDKLIYHLQRQIKSEGNDVVNRYDHYFYMYTHILELHNLGYLPIEIRALPEGSYVNCGVPCIEVTNTHPKFAWVVQWIECILQAELWKICNHATIGKIYANIAKKYYDETVDNGISWRTSMSDFGMRGMSCVNEAQRCSSAWLLSFDKTSTIPSLQWLENHYHFDVNGSVGKGAISTEHSVISTNSAWEVANAKCIDENDPHCEARILRKFLTEIYPNESFSVLGDTYDYWNFIDNIIPMVKDEILNHEGKMLVRPDSGNIVEISVKTIQKLWDMFGGTINSKGYKVLDPHIGVIYGDACTTSNVKEIWSKLKDLGFAANNIVFGVGAFCFTAFFDDDNKLIVNTRDTFGLAMKTSAAEFSDIGFQPIYKDPKTDSNLKKSHKGCCAVVKDENGYKCIDGLKPNEHKTEMQLIYKDGKLLKEQTFDEIRERLTFES